MSDLHDAPDLRELEEERDHLLRSLDDLDRERAAGDIDEADYVALKDDYTARAAAALRALEPPDPIVTRAPAGGALPRNERRGRRRPVLTTVALVAFAVTAGAVVARSAGDRLPGDPATGEIAATGPTAALTRDLARARDLIGQARTLDAIKLYDAILQDHPEQPEALAYRGWLLRLAGRSAGDQELVDKGMEYIERAVVADPSYPDARFFKGFVLYQDRDDAAAAVPELRAFLANNPPSGMVPVVEDLLRRALADAQAGTTTTTAPPP
ncbi:MAG: tetratricopeptide repeat protein [Acidimicrobiales bacterium]